MEIIDIEDNIVPVKTNVYTTRSNTAFNQSGELEEEFVDLEKRRKGLTPACQRFYISLQLDFPNKLISFKDIYEHHKTQHQYPAIVQWMRMLWKAGKVRRFFRGRWRNAEEKRVTGLKYGVYYFIPKEETDYFNTLRFYTLK